MNRLATWAGYWIRDPLWGAVDNLTFAALRCLSWRQASDAGARIGAFARNRFRQADTDTIANLKTLQPHADPADIERLAAQMWRNIGRSLTELAVLDKYPVPGNIPVIDIAMILSLDRSRPVIFLYPHLGNWEMLARFIVSHGFRLNVIYELLPNRFQRRLVERARRRSGYTLVAPDLAGTRRIHSALAAGESIGMAIDEFKHNRVVSPWFDDTPSPNSNIHKAVRLARKYDANIVFGYCLRKGETEFEIVCGGMIDPAQEPGGEAGERALVDRINRWCRQCVSEHPEQWYMLHRARLRSLVIPGPRSGTRNPEGV